MRIREVRKAPDLTLPDASGRPASLADFKGQDVIVQYRLPFLFHSDPDRKVMMAWAAHGEKMMYGKTKGVIRSTVWVGPDGVVRKHWARVVDAARHPAAVLEAVREGAG